MKVIKQAFPREIADTLLEPIRSKKDYLMFLMEVSKLLLLSHPFEVKENGVEVELVVKKFSRIFCGTKGRYFSVGFPFLVSMEGNKIESIRTYFDLNIDHKSIAAVIGVLNTYADLHEVIAYFNVSESKLDDLGYEILAELITYESGYLRYDYDRERENGALHPLYHLDINFGNYNQYKLGFAREKLIPDLIDLVDIETNCLFLENK